MTENPPAMQTDLDRLADRVEKAAALVQQLRDDRTRLGQKCAELERRLQELEQGLQGQDAATLTQELGALRKEQREWIGERREVAQRIEALLKKLERLEG